jgi:hypothetical protein
MQKADSLILRYNAPLIIVASIMNNMTISRLVEHGYSSSSVLIYRSAITFLITIMLSAGNGAGLLPKNFRQQGLFMLNAGVSLFLLFQSYAYLTASTIAMVQRLDIPFAVILGFVLGKRKSDFRLGLSVFAVCVVFSIFLFASQIHEKPKGLLMAIVAIMMTSYSYMLIKKSTGEENNFVIVNTVNIGCIVVGLASGLIAGNLSVIKFADIWLFAGASLSQFLLNYSMAVLFKHHDIERGRRPYLISVIMVLIVEQLWTGRLFDFRHSGVVIIVVGLMYLITLKDLPFSKKRNAKELPEDVIEPI